MVGDREECRDVELRNGACAIEEEEEEAGVLDADPLDEEMLYVP